MDAAALAAFGLPDVSRYVVPVCLVLPAVLLGWVTGFLLLEDRDEGTLLAVDVTPVGKSGFLAYRTGVTAVLALGVTLYAWPLVMPAQDALTALLIAMLVALSAIGFAVVLPAVARNKVEGLAVTKLANLLTVAPLLAAIPSPWRFLASPLPPFWLGELLRLTDVTPAPAWLAAVAGLLVTCLALLLLFGLFARRTG
jgi:fluoroquinolone transport system permease protein